MIFYNMAEQLRKFKVKKIQMVISNISETAVQEIFNEPTQRQRIYHLQPLMRVLISQIATGESCRSAISRGIHQGWLPVTTSLKTSAYCNARARLPENGFRELALRTGRLLEKAAEERWIIGNRQVKVIDSTSFQMPDTSENQREYRQPSMQKPGCGFPVMITSVLMGLESGGVIDVETRCGTGHEHAMFRDIWRSLERGDIVLGDAGYGSYAEIAMLQKMGVDCVFREGIRKFKPENAVKIDDCEWLQMWKRPTVSYKWIDSEELPETIPVRVIRVVVNKKGFRSRTIVLYTTLIDSEKYPLSDLVELYRRRWEMELRFRDIKTTMGLEMFRCKTPTGCRKELWVGLLLYNLIRTVMLDAALRYKICMSRLSFKSALNGVTESIIGKLVNLSPVIAYEIVIRNIADALNPYRPNRVEPRKLKRRPKNYGLLTRPRQIERELIIIGYMS
jgi:hypothetical protein